MGEGKPIEGLIDDNLDYYLQIASGRYVDDQEPPSQEVPPEQPAAEEDEPVQS